MILDALWNTLHDLATGLGWLGLGVIAYFLIVVAATRMFDRVLGGEEGRRERHALEVEAELRNLEAQHRKEIECMGGRRLPELPLHSSERRSA